MSFFYTDSPLLPGEPNYETSPPTSLPQQEEDIIPPFEDDPNYIPPYSPEAIPPQSPIPERDTNPYTSVLSPSTTPPLDDEEYSPSAPPFLRVVKKPAPLSPLSSLPLPPGGQ